MAAVVVLVTPAKDLGGQRAPECAKSTGISAVLLPALGWGEETWGCRMAKIYNALVDSGSVVCVICILVFGSCSALLLYNGSELCLQNMFACSPLFNVHCR